MEWCVVFSASEKTKRTMNSFYFYLFLCTCEYLFIIFSLNQRVCCKMKCYIHMHYSFVFLYAAMYTCQWCIELSIMNDNKLHA